MFRLIRDMILAIMIAGVLIAALSAIMYLSFLLVPVLILLGVSGIIFFVLQDERKR